MKPLAVIPARGGSKGVPRKNLTELDGKPLIQHTIEDALESELISYVVVSTEDQEVAEVSVKCGADVVYRPPHLAADYSRSEQAVEHVIYELEAVGELFDPIVLMQCTSPFRRPGDIDSALRFFQHQQYNSLFSASEITQFLWKVEPLDRLIEMIGYRPMRQAKKAVVTENGSFWITRRDVYVNFHDRLHKPVTFYLQPSWCGIEIENEEDLEVCRNLIGWLKQSGRV